MYFTLLPLIASAMLHGGVEVNQGVPKLQALTPKLAVVKKHLVHRQKAFVPMHISAIGMRYDPCSGEIYYIDPASDLHGKVIPGDYLISTGGQGLVESGKSLNYFGDVDTIIEVKVCHNGLTVVYKCHRKPLEKFTPSLCAGLRSQLCP
jgi:hypothetical protein